MRYPLLVGRGEQLVVDVPLPASLEDGYVYVPAGRFLFGSAEPDDVRKGITLAQPQHSATTGAYLIGRYEVTLGEWIEYLASLPDSERRQRMPHADGIELVADRDGRYRLTLRPSSIEYVVGQQDAIVYATRTRRRAQNWMRLPVAGVNYEDAIAYTKWLDETGRLPGARLCTVLEWERAARGADSRTFPHGGVVAPDDLNFDRTYGRTPGGYGPDEVGSHPASDSPFGVSDLAGNVWEMLAPTDRNNEYPIRSGAFYEDIMGSRSTNGAVTEPTLRDNTIGLRVCASTKDEPR